MLSGKRKKDHAAESAAEALEAQATALGYVPQTASDDDEADADESLEESDEDEAALVAA